MNIKYVNNLYKKTFYGNTKPRKFSIKKRKT